MADEFSTAAVCGGGWWNPTRNMFGSYLCSASMNDIGSFAWPLSHHDGEVTAEVKGRPPSTDHSSTAAATATDDWNQVLMQDNERGDRSYGSMLQEDLNYGVQQTLTVISSSSQELSTSFPITSYNYPPDLLKSMFDTDPHQPHQQCLISNQPVISYAPPSMAAMTNYGQNLSDFSPSPTKFSSLLAPTNQHLQFPSSLSLWNSSLTHCSFPSPTFTDKKPAITAKSNGSNKELRDSSCLANKTSTAEPDFKRPRIETPSPLPTFKVRKEKLGDRITALQQLVSPFGKTDTASVLHEAIEYIKFLHDHVNVLITPYMKNGSPSDQHCQQNTEEVLDEEGLSKQDLRSRGLCLVPMSSTFPVAAEATTDFWTPTFGANFR